MSLRLRCAIYTRKSSEEGLEQNFNSLHAQREACEAYVLSQTGEGWSPIKTAYDDGGFSGGSLERPGLKQLLADIERGLIDVVVVYKVDRLTRSLADFAKIVEAFDAKGVSFVSVTQAFNTTTSMGRLTLNVLLSFAQFERGVTGERIRDKIAASKAKGLRMGGRPPLGYDIVDGRLQLNEREAQTVRGMFESYLELGSVRDLHAHLFANGIEGKRWMNRREEPAGGGVMQRGALHYLLSNPVYRGATRHKEKLHEATHPAIIDANLWDRVQAQLEASNGRRPVGETRGEGASLQGLIFDDRDNPMVAVHTTRGVTRYRYYVSRPKITGQGEAGSLARVAAGMIEPFLLEQMEPKLSASWRPGEAGLDRLTAALVRVTLGSDAVTVVAKADALVADQGGDDAGGNVALTLPIYLRRRHGAVIVQSVGQALPAGRLDRALIRALALAQVWARSLEVGEIASIKDLAKREGLCAHYAARLLPLAYLAPDLTETILAGRQSRTLTLKTLTDQPLPIAWEAQRRLVSALA